MMRNGIAYQLPPLVRLTDETGSGSWPTPRAIDGRSAPGNTADGCHPDGRLGTHRPTPERGRIQRRRTGGSECQRTACSGRATYQCSVRRQSGRREQQERDGRLARWWASEPDVGRVAHGVPLELDCIRRLNAWASDNSEAKSEAQRLIWRIVQFVWINQELAATSPNLYRERLCGLVPAMPRESAHNGWLLGHRLKEKEELRDLWHRVYAAPFEKAFDMFPELLERIRQEKRPEEVASRVDHLQRTRKRHRPANRGMDR